MAFPRLAPFLFLLLLLLADASTSAVISDATATNALLSTYTNSADADLSTITCREGRGCEESDVDEDDDDEAEEEEIDGGDDRRQLLGRRRRFLSYDMLKKNRVPCNRRGVSYYNCKQHGRANPYRRGCSYITRCARDLR